MTRLSMLSRLLLALLMIRCTPIAEAAQPLEVTRESDGVTVRLGKETFARYLKRSGTRPILWPLVGPTGQRVTRSYPIAGLEKQESSDHIHHRSMWIGYEGINGIDFWHEPEPKLARRLPIGTIEHQEFVRADSTGDVATIVTLNNWLAPDGRCVSRDRRLLEFHASDTTRTIDYTIDLWSPDGPLVFDDTKEGFFAIRVAGPMKVDAGLGGRISNSLGETNKQAWGQPAEWVDYSGPVEEGEAGIAIFAHPSNAKPAPRWHVRPYGLLAVNPFGEAPYSGRAAKKAGGLRVPQDEVVRLRFRILLHGGQTDPEALRNESKDFSARPQTKPYTP